MPKAGKKTKRIKTKAQEGWKQSTFRREMREIKKNHFRSSPGLIMMATLVINLLGLALPLMLLQVYDRIIANGSTGTLFWLASGVVIALIFEVILKQSRSFVMGFAAAIFEHRMSLKAVGNWFTSDLKTHSKDPTSTHLERFNAIAKLRSFIGGQAVIAIVDIPFIALFILVMAWLAGPIALIPVGLLVCFAAISFIHASKLKKHMKARSAAEDNKFNTVLSTLDNIHTTKALALEPQQMRRIEAAQAELTNSHYKASLANLHAGTMGGIFMQIALVCVVAVGALFVLDGRISTGALAACTLLTGRVMQPVVRLLTHWLKYQELHVAKIKLNELFKTPAREAPIEEFKRPTNCDIIIDAVQFSFDDAALIKNANLKIPTGNKIALLGMSGTGKTTLLKMIAGLIKPDNGTITIGKLNPLDCGNQLISYLPQSATLFEGTIMENLTCFRDDDIIVQKARNVAASLGIDQAIAGLPQGYETAITGGASDPIPPGVRQRVAVARGLISDAPILLFDDADRALDQEGYNLLFRYLGRMERNPTIIMVSRDFNLLSLVDKAYELKNGELGEVPLNKAQELTAFINQNEGL